MDREKFISQLDNTDENINMNWVLEVINRSVDSNLSDSNSRGHKNLIIVMEELAELGKEISKELRGWGGLL